MVYWQGSTLFEEVKNHKFNKLVNYKTMAKLGQVAKKWPTVLFL